MNIAFAFKWGVASVGITLLGMTHLIWEKHFRCGIYTGGRLSSEAARVKKVDIWLLLFTFYNFFLEQTSSDMYFFLCKRIVFEITCIFLHMSVLHFKALPCLAEGDLHLGKGGLCFSEPEVVLYSGFCLA